MGTILYTSTDITSPNFMFEYGGDRNNITEDTEVLEMHAVEKQLMSIDAAATTPTRCVVKQIMMFK